MFDTREWQQIGLKTDNKSSQNVEYFVVSSLNTDTCVCVRERETSAGGVCYRLRCVSVSR